MKKETIQLVIRERERYLQKASPMEDSNGNSSASSSPTSTTKQLQRDVALLQKTCTTLNHQVSSLLPSVSSSF